MNFRFAARFTTLTTAISATLVFALPFVSHAQDLEDDASIPAAESNAPVPSGDLNEAVDQLSRESRGSGLPPASTKMRGYPVNAPGTTDVGHAPSAPPAHHAKAFAQKSKVKAPKRKPVKVARRAASTGKAHVKKVKPGKSSKKKRAH